MEYARIALALTTLFLTAPGAARVGVQAQPGPELVSLQWLEPVKNAPGRDLPVLQSLPAGDPRLAQAEKLADNEAARYIRRLIAVAHRVAGRSGGTLPPLPVLLQPGGNNARTGFYLLAGAEARPYPDTPYVVLDLDADRLSLTFLHEGGHVADRIVRGATRREAGWSALPHSTFAVTDPVTALSEGFAISLETLWGHYGSDPGRRGWYHRTDPGWDAAQALRNEFFSPVRDLLSFSQNWARYSAVRDGLPAFEGHVYAGDYLRSQYDPARDRSRLKQAGALVASEGVVASVCFWIAEAVARDGGAAPLAGLDQPALLNGGRVLLEALRDASRASPARATDLVDVVGAVGAPGSDLRRRAIERFLAATRGGTALPGIQQAWHDLYRSAASLDIQKARQAIETLGARRAALVKAALEDPSRLRAAIGPVLPVRLDRVRLRLVALGEPFPASFDLNAMGQAELLLLSSEDGVRGKIEAAMQAGPFRSFEDFESRTGVTLSSLGAVREAWKF